MIHSLHKDMNTYPTMAKNETSPSLANIGHNHWNQRLTLYVHKTNVSNLLSTLVDPTLYGTTHRKFTT